MILQRKKEKLLYFFSYELGFKNLHSKNGGFS